MAYGVHIISPQQQLGEHRVADLPACVIVRLYAGPTNRIEASQKTPFVKDGCHPLSARSYEIEEETMSAPPSLSHRVRTRIRVATFAEAIFGYALAGGGGKEAHTNMACTAFCAPDMNHSGSMFKRALH